MQVDPEGERGYKDKASRCHHRQDSFSVHTDATIARARRLFAFAQRATFGAGPVALRTLFTALELPQLKYCAPVSLAHQASRVARLASGERRAAFAILKRNDAASLRLLLAVVGPLGASHPLAGYIRRPRTNDLAHILPRTVRHHNSFVPRVMSLGRFLPKALRSQPAADADEVKSLCRQAVRHLRTVH
ncbi:hypothetical protein HPB48_014873 [Haemaphysalis longicornis]|uniref:Uncharacterized protein n=1 Tax=Haemaphysalis longicornis TaxID=44386 RepID=A0A9J6FRM3_HAELO|nr:hypothetical protein HPB48_014873 [Haemaphysalis longicornis]